MAWQTTGGNLKGPQGLKGDTGATGRHVTAAEVNEDGELVLTFNDTGVQNLGVVKGVDGQDGQDGAQGPKGDDGTSVTITGTVADASALPVDLGPEDAGNGYITEDDGHLHVWSGTAFVDAGEIRGPAGADGQDGVDGTDGSQGAKGDKGDDGARGTQWFVGSGAPNEAELTDALEGDKYLDTDTGDIYTLAGDPI